MLFLFSKFSWKNKKLSGLIQYIACWLLVPNVWPLQKNARLADVGNCSCWESCAKVHRAVHSGVPPIVHALLSSFSHWSASQLPLMSRSMIVNSSPFNGLPLISIIYLPFIQDTVNDFALIQKPGRKNFPDVKSKCHALDSEYWRIIHKPLGFLLVRLLTAGRATALLFNCRHLRMQGKPCI